MSEFRFSLSNLESHREGVIESDSFVSAVDALGQQVSVRAGDQLEIGVLGFPPARFECVGAFTKGRPVWMPAGRLAA
jgi:hypothetical protein